MKNVNVSKAVSHHLSGRTEEEHRRLQGTWNRLGNV